MFCNIYILVSGKFYVHPNLFSEYISCKCYILILSHPCLLIDEIPSNFLAQITASLKKCEKEARSSN